MTQSSISLLLDTVFISDLDKVTWHGIIVLGLRQVLLNVSAKLKMVLTSKVAISDFKILFLPIQRYFLKIIDRNLTPQLSHNLSVLPIGFLQDKKNNSIYLHTSHQTKVQDRKSAIRSAIYNVSNFHVCRHELREWREDKDLRPRLVEEDNWTSELSCADGYFPG